MTFGEAVMTALHRRIDRVTERLERLERADKHIADDSTPKAQPSDFIRANVTRRQRMDFITADTSRGAAIDAGAKAIQDHLQTVERRTGTRATVNGLRLVPELSPFEQANAVDMNDWLGAGGGMEQANAVDPGGAVRNACIEAGYLAEDGRHPAGD